MDTPLPIGSLLTRRPAYTPVRRVALLLLLLLIVGTLVGTWWKRREESRRSHRYDSVIRECGERHRVSPFLIKAIIRQETDFRQGAVGAAGEAGLMQITPGAVQDWERRTGQRCPAPGMLFDPRVNIEIGTWYIARALNRWEANPDQEVWALAQYNAGIAHVLNWIADDATRPALERIRFPSTREYIRRVIHYRENYENECRRNP